MGNKTGGVGITFTSDGLDGEPFLCPFQLSGLEDVLDGDPPVFFPSLFRSPFLGGSPETAYQAYFPVLSYTILYFFYPKMYWIGCTDYR